MKLTALESKFATDNHGIIGEYLRMRNLPEDDWYDVVVFRYLRSVMRFFREPKLQGYSFRTIAYQAMRSAVGNEQRKEARRIQTVSLDEVIPGTDGMTLADTITEDNLNYRFPLGRSDDGMQLRYNVKLPPKQESRGFRKSDERIAIEAFMESSHKNMCFEYDTGEEAKRKLSTINSTRKAKNEVDIYDTYRVGKCVYIVRKEKEAKGNG